MTRRIRPRPEYAVPYWVDVLVNKFEHPEQRREAPFDLGGGGGAPTIVIAAENSLDIEKRKADLLCTGLNDQDVIQLAIDQLSFGGRILLCSGTFNISFGGTRHCLESGGFSGWTLEGMGIEASILNVTDSFSGSTFDRYALDFTDADIIVRNLTIQGGDGENGATNGLILGDQNRVRDVLFAVDGVGVLLSSGPTVVDACQFINGEEGLIVAGEFCKVINSHLNTGGTGMVLVNSIGGFMLIEGNTFDRCGGDGIASQGAGIDGVVRTRIANNVIRRTNSYGISIHGDDNMIQNNLIVEPGIGTSNSFDGILIDGTENYLSGNKILASALANTTRYGINIAGDCNRVVGNDLGEPAGYGSDALNDAGTDTQLVYPDHLTYGDNFTECTPSSPSSPTSPTSPPEGEGFALLGDDGDSVSTPDSAQLDITGDIDIRVCVAADEWDNGGIGALSRQTMIGKWVESGNQRSWRFQWLPSGGDVFPFFSWSANGSSGISLQATNSVTLTDGVPYWLRFTLDVAVLSQRTYAFYWSDEPPDTDPALVTWTLVQGATGGTNTSIFASTAPLRIGHTTGDEAQFLGKFYYAEVRDGIDGAIVANPDFRDTAQADWSLGSGDDDEGNTWTFNGGASWSPPS